MKDATYLVNDLTKERKKRAHEPNRAFRMCFPILKYMALETESYSPQKAQVGSVTAYTLENTKLDITNNGNTERGRIDKATIFRSLKLLEQAYLIKATEEKVCRDGRVRKKYVVTPQGVVALLQGHPDHVEISKKYVSDLAEKQKSFLPLVFGKWDYFRQQQLEDQAYKVLHDSVKNGEIMDMVYPLASLGRDVNPFGSAWLYIIQESVLRHGIYGFMLVLAWLDEDKDSPWAREWLKAIRSDKDLLDTARKEVLRHRLEEEMDAIDWNHVLKELDTGDLGSKLNLLEGSTDNEEDRRLYRWMYGYYVAAEIDKGATPMSFHDFAMKGIREYVKHRECPKCGEINATSSFQLSKPCEKCGEKLDPNQLTARFAPPDTP